MKEVNTPINFSRNEALGMMYENTADALRRIADYIEKYQLDYEESVKLLREISDTQEAQSMVVQLRDELNPENKF